MSRQYQSPVPLTPQGNMVSNQQNSMSREIMTGEQVQMPTAPVSAPVVVKLV